MRRREPQKCFELRVHVLNTSAAGTKGPQPKRLPSNANCDVRRMRRNRPQREQRFARAEHVPSKSQISINHCDGVSLATSRWISLDIQYQSRGGVTVEHTPERIEAIKNMTAPQTKTQLRSFLGMLNYFRDSVPMLGPSVVPLSRLAGPKGKGNFKKASGRSSISKHSRRPRRQLLVPSCSAILITRYRFDFAQMHVI
jgi:hypothetical protein